MFKKILVVLAVLISGVVAFAATRPATYRVQRSAKIDAPAPVVFAQLDDFKAWAAWSPWEDKDPQMRKTFDGAPRGVGASYAWQGNNQVGEGRMTIVESRPPAWLKLRLEFIKPFAAVASTELGVRSEGPKSADVSWAMEGTNNLVAKIFGLFMDMDQMIGRDFEKGLTSLRQISEAEARRVEVAEAAAKAAAEAAAAAEKARVEAEAAAAAAAAEEEEKAAKDADAKKKAKKKH